MVSVCSPQVARGLTPKVSCKRRPIIARSALPPIACQLQRTLGRGATGRYQAQSHLNQEGSPTAPAPATAETFRVATASVALTRGGLKLLSCRSVRSKVRGSIQKLGMGAADCPGSSPPRHHRPAIDQNLSASARVHAAGSCRAPRRSRSWCADCTRSPGSRARHRSRRASSRSPSAPRPARRS